MGNKRRIHWLRYILLGVAVFFVLMDIGLGLWITLLSNESFLAKLYPPFEDTDFPVVELKGDAKTTLLVGAKYKDAGVDAYDVSSEVSVTTEGEVDENTIGEYKIKYYVTDEVGNTTEAERRVEVVPREKLVYLTFDDGPGDYTAALLDVLKKYDVKATFFVTGAGSDDLIKREYDEGHAIGLHTASHNYSYIYANMDNFFADLNAVQDRVKRITGQETHLMRFPGGSSNTVSMRYDGRKHIMSQLVKEVEARGYIYFDWNVLSGDAGETNNTDVVYNNVVNSLKPDSSVVLQHDIKDFSVAAVERIIQYGKENGYRFLKLDDTAFKAHHGVNN